MHTATKYDIPAAYGVTFLTLLVRDPRCIFAQWEVTEFDRLDAVRRATALHGTGDGHNPERTRLVLRIYDVTDAYGADHSDDYRHSSPPLGHRSTFRDIIVDGHQSRYITSEPGRAYRGQVGITVADDPATFTAVAVSNPVRTPPGRASDQVDAQWSTLEEVFRTAMTAAPAGSSVEWARLREERVDAFSPGFYVKGNVPVSVSGQEPLLHEATNEEGSG